MWRVPTATSSALAAARRQANKPTQRTAFGCRLLLWRAIRGRGESGHRPRGACVKLTLGLALCLVASAGCIDIAPLGPPRQPVPKQYGTLQGTVELIDGGFASGITARLVRMEPCFLCGWPGNRTHIADATADATGVFRFEHVEVGRYNVNLGGYQDYFTWGDRGVTLRADQVTTVTYVIKRLTDPVRGDSIARSGRRL